jgi:hypothetical protein
MKIHYSYRREDFEDISEVADKARPKNRRIRIAYILLGVWILILPFLAAWSLRHPDWSLWPIYPVALFLICMGLQTPKRIARRQYSSAVPRYAYDAEISENGIVTSSPSVRTELRWEAFSRCIGGNNVVGLVCEAVMYLFPRRAFTKEQWTEFMRLIAEHVPG